MKLVLCSLIGALVFAACVSQTNANASIKNCKARVAYMKAVLKDPNAARPSSVSADVAKEIRESDPCVLKRDIDFMTSRIQDAESALAE